MIAFFLAAADLVALPDDSARATACQALVASDSAAAIAQATQWADRDRSLPARVCLGQAFAAAGRWAPAAATFEQAAAAADVVHDPRAGPVWSQAGNAALAADQPAKARDDLDRVLGRPDLPDVLAGEAWIDRARADVALGEAAQARIDLNKGLALVPSDPFAWLLSATLARRQADLPRARKDIAVALRDAADDPDVQLEAGTIAAASGDTPGARLAWTRAAQLGAGEPSGKAASALLAEPAAAPRP